MMEYKVADREFRDESGKLRQFHYYVTVDPVETPNFFCETYGVHIREDPDNEASVHAVTTSATRIDELMSILIENLVGPTTLRDTVDDWL